jgi:hypothetical protein
MFVFLAKKSAFFAPNECLDTIKKLIRFNANGMSDRDRQICRLYFKGMVK